MGRAFHKQAAARADQTAWDRILDKHPPQITWVKIRGGIRVAVDVVDPHAELNGPRVVCKRNHEFTPENTIVRANGGQTCRECRRWREREANAKKKAECTNESLLAAARSEI